MGSEKILSTTDEQVIDGRSQVTDASERFGCSL